VPSANFYQLKQALSLLNFMINTFYTNEGIQHVVVFGSSQHEDEVHELLKSADFRELNIPPEFSGSPMQLQSDIDSRVVQAETNMNDLKDSVTELLARNRPTLNKVHDVLILARPYASLAMVLKGKGGLVSLQGWVPARRDDDIRLKLGQHLEFPFHVEFADPHRDEFDAVPSLLKKSWLLKPFQNLVRNFGIPGYAEVDPSGLFALSYILMFGMMFGDVGHGAVIMLLGILLWKRYAGFAIVAALAGLSSIFFGFMYGSIFGYEQILQALWMSPMHDPTQALLVAVLWGASFLMVANGLAIRNFLAQGLTQQAFYASKGLPGLIFYAGAIYIGYLVFTDTALGWFEALLLVVPMGVILQYQWRQSTGGIGERVLVVLIEGLEHIISTVSATLSFLRVAAFSLNHIALAAAVFAIAGMMGSIGHWLTIVLGNIFIIVLEGAIVAIQCLRLEYYEGFSRFFSGKGKAFEALKIEL
jgi:V/A-type H+-transporting ATPase subunit I